MGGIILEPSFAVRISNAYSIRSGQGTLPGYHATSDNVVKAALTGVPPGDTAGSLAYVILPCIHHAQASSGTPYFNAGEIFNTAVHFQGPSSQCFVFGAECG